MVIPGERGKTYRFTLDSFVLLSFAVFCVVFIGASAFFSYDYFVEQLDRKQLTNLHNENEFLNGELSDMHKTISDLRDDYAAIVDKEKAIRVIFDLPDIDEQERQLGIGGPVFLDLSAKSKAERVAYQTESDIDELARLSSFESEQFKTIYGVMLDKKDELDHIPSIMPCAGYQTRGYGLMTHPISGFKQMHSGIDIANRVGTPIYATAAGVVSYAGNRGKLGRTIIIDHGNGIETVYGHLNKFTIKKGQKVKRGDKIAEMGNTGYSTGVHLHYAVTVNHQTVNPRKYIISYDWNYN